MTPERHWLSYLTLAVKVAIATEDLVGLQAALSRIEDEFEQIPPDAVSEPTDGPLEPGERVINGVRWYSAAWLSDPHLTIVKGER